MIKVNVCVILCIAATAFGAEKSFLNDGGFDGKLQRFQEDLKQVAALTRNLSLEAPGCKEKFIDMSNDFMYTFRTTTYEINHAVPSLKDKYLKDGVAQILGRASKLKYQIQNYLHDNIEKLQEYQASEFEEFSVLVHKLAAIVKKAECKNKNFLANQIQKSLNQALFAVQKFKFQTQFFLKANKELEHEIDAGVETLCKTLQNLKGDDYKVREELLHLIQDFEDVLDSAVVKLENFVHLNTGDEKCITTVKEVSKGLNTLSDRLFQLTSESHDIAHYKTQFEKLYKDVTNEIKKLLTIEIGETIIGGLFIRSILFDSISASYVFERELSSC